MTLEEIKKLKYDAEVEISVLLSEFEKKTNTSIKSLEIVHGSSFGTQTTFVSNVKIKIEL